MSDLMKRYDRAIELLRSIRSVGLKDSIAEKVDAFLDEIEKDLAKDIPDCNCGYSRSDSMIDHHDDCAYIVFGRKHGLKRVPYDVRDS